ncbi:uncharacterized protein LOC132714839 [Ruditapes philippinarum]|uniref:uncharacterized protein LOC132714839 n=1 Tax=Ruditapes philippinarum TaxID=129788 RepID=UPI00295C060B|nr:uncharacterized protein LOC132714839 [Ruditapes philippinarum]
MNSDSLYEIKSYFDAKFADFKKGICKGSVVKTQKFTVLKNKGNQIQLDHNCELLDCIVPISGLIESGEHSEALELCETAKEKIERRNKLIKLADKSPSGWLTVHEYEQDDLASDDEDSKRIKKAEKAAASIIKNSAMKQRKRTEGS